MALLASGQFLGSLRQQNLIRAPYGACNYPDGGKPPTLAHPFLEAIFGLPEALWWTLLPR